MLRGMERDRVPGGGEPGQARPAWLAGLVRAAAEWPLERKVLVCPRRGPGREALRRLGLELGGWANFEIATASSLAVAIATAGLGSGAAVTEDEFEEAERIDASIDAAVAEPGGEGLLAWVDGAGLRDAMANSVRALRLGGVTAAELGRVAFRDGAKREAIGRVLEQYERRLYNDRRVDRAGVLRQAIESLRVGSVPLPPGRYLILPGVTRRGLAGALVELLIERGATLLPDDAVRGLARPAAHVPSPEAAPAGLLSFLHAPVPASDPAPGGEAIELFAASSAGDEVREVLRRSLAGGYRWDEVEIVATDPMLYGTALDTLARRLGLSATYAAGLPTGRTRAGRAAAAYLGWLGGGLAEDVVRAAIERGDIEPPPGGNASSGPALARLLRRLRIGRGLARYRSALARARLDPRVLLPFDSDLPPGEYDEALAAERRVFDDLAALLEPVLDAVPSLPDPVSGQGDAVSAGDVARGMLAVLARVPDGSGADQATKAKLEALLQRLAETAVRPTSLEAAIARVAGKIDARAGAVDARGTVSWRAAPGAILLSDVQGGGLSGRPATFVVGLDAVRFPGAVQQDTLLGDEERRRLARGAGFSPIPTTSERLDERRYALAVLLARLRGRVTFSYAAWDAAEARTVAPAAEMLQAFRLRERDWTADYDRLHRALDARACSVPRGAANLDASDVWLRSLAVDGVLLHGADIVRSGFPGLDAGVRAAELRAGAAFTAHHGRIGARPGLDPRTGSGAAVSPSRLEMLGACPLRYLMRWVLGARPLLDTEFRADRWLTPLDRGSLLHSVYERALRQQRSREVPIEADAFEALALDALEIELSRWRDRLPPPGEATYGVEAASLAEDVRAFVRMARATGADWVVLEYRFGQRGAAPRESPDSGTALPNAPVRIPLREGTLDLAGRIDRVDRDAEGRLVVIDYKTGGVEAFGRQAMTFNRGRRLQHALYAEVVERLFGEVARAEYHFPTRRGETQVAGFEIDALRWGSRIAGALLDLTGRGWFHPTTDPEDCRHCDYREVCRARPGRKEVRSPLAEWSARVVETQPELAVMRALMRERE